MIDCWNINNYADSNDIDDCTVTIGINDITVSVEYDGWTKP